MLKHNLQKKYLQSVAPGVFHQPKPYRPPGLRTRLGRLFIFFLLLFLFLLALPWLIRFWVQWRVQERIYSLEDAIPAADVAIVFGAGLWGDGSPTPVLHDRVATAVDLYRAGLVKKLLLSGDNRFISYNEPGAMRQLALDLGVPDEDIVLDYAGRRTYDSCYRAKEIFVVERAIIVTQRFHLDRAVYLCDSLGIQTIGVVADRHAYRQQSWWYLRELVATSYAWFDINLFQPLPVLGEQLPITP